jgi:hypothetical protein
MIKALFFRLCLDSYTVLEVLYRSQEYRSDANSYLDK